MSVNGSIGLSGCVREIAVGRPVKASSSAKFVVWSSRLSTSVIYYQHVVIMTRIIVSILVAMVY